MTLFSTDKLCQTNNRIIIILYYDLSFLFHIRGFSTLSHSICSSWQKRKWICLSINTSWLHNCFKIVWHQFPEVSRIGIKQPTTETRASIQTLSTNKPSVNKHAVFIYVAVGKSVFGMSTGNSREPKNAITINCNIRYEVYNGLFKWSQYILFNYSLLTIFTLCIS